ncbi:MAG TPA: hypothetical protein VNE82_03685 [Candidatus Binataceae bacterium]|nr:hypothetical protein [Candidatus Binataceae bacterium]
MKTDQHTYDEVMLDWAIAELLSPTWMEFWNSPLCEELRTKLKNEGIDSLSVYERTWLIARLVNFRYVIILEYGPSHYWSFKKRTFSCEALSGFSIIHQFNYPPSFSFGQLSKKIREHPARGPIVDEPAMRERARKMLDLSSRGQEPFGFPIAIERPAPMPPVLIEGYKRSMVALWAGCPSMEIYLCTPPTATVP